MGDVSATGTYHGPPLLEKHRCAKAFVLLTFTVMKVNLLCEMW
jgi:hypothetical protein